MVKKILLFTLVFLLTGYIAFAVIFMNPKASADKECTKMYIEVVKSSDVSYLNEALVESLLQRANLNPMGKKMSEISMESIETTLESNKLIKTAESYKTVDGTVKIKVFQRTPILRIMTGSESYFIDSEGEKMPIPPDFTAYLPLATGRINEAYAKTQLYNFALFLQKDKFWNSQIEQIHIEANLDVELIPKLGNHRIILGKMEDYKGNLNKLKLFYNKGLNKVGWNRYSIINLKYKNQVVCTKQD
jgi:cell division protein FtsQ